MANILKQGAKFLNDQMHAHASLEVSYLRDGLPAEDIQARIGRTESDSIDNDGLVIQHKSRDFIIQVSDLVLDGSLATPQKGDRITEPDDDASLNHIYEVASENGGAVYTQGDAFRNSFRIHTKLLRTEAQ